MKINPNNVLNQLTIVKRKTMKMMNMNKMMKNSIILEREMMRLKNSVILKRMLMRSQTLKTLKE
jgi:hypothetical protein